MSLPRSVAHEICQHLAGNPSSVLGARFFDCKHVEQVEISTKAEHKEKLEHRFLVISKFRIFIVHGKSIQTLRVDRHFHVLSLRDLTVIAGNELLLTWEDGRKLFVRVSTVDVTQSPAHRLAIKILSSLRHYFPDVDSKQLSDMINIVPGTLYDTFGSMVPDVAPRACHSFRRTYAALCDLHDVPYRDEVAWDVEKIYSANLLNVLRLDDFSHLPTRELVPIVDVLQFSSHFVGLSVDGLRLTPELLDAILTVLKRARYLSSLYIRSAGLPKDALGQFAGALAEHGSPPLSVLDLSKNALDDKKAAAAFARQVPRLIHLRELRLVECSLSDKCVQHLCEGLMGRVRGDSGLHTLVLASNPLKEDSTALLQLLAQSNSIRHLDLTDTGVSADRIWAALRYGGLRIERLLLSGCPCTNSKKMPEDTGLAKDFFSACVDLKELSLAGCQPSADLLRAILIGLASNDVLGPLNLRLDGLCGEGTSKCLASNWTAIAQAFDKLGSEGRLSHVRVHSLSMRDCAFDADWPAVLAAISHLGDLRRLDVGGPHGLRVQHSTASPAQSRSREVTVVTVQALVRFVEESNIEQLVLSDARLSSQLNMLFNSLGSVTRLRYLDVTGNDMGNFGARLLAKALQLNTSLRTVLCDRNGLTADGLADLAHALKLNRSLYRLDAPISDSVDAQLRGGTAAATERSRSALLIADINASLARNRGDCDSTSENDKFLSGVDQSGGLKEALLYLHYKTDGVEVAETEQALASISQKSMPDQLWKSAVASLMDAVRGNIIEDVQTLREVLSPTGATLSSDAPRETVLHTLLTDLRTRIERSLESNIRSFEWRVLVEDTDWGPPRQSAAGGGVSKTPHSPAIDSPFVKRKGSSSSSSTPQHHRPRSTAVQNGFSPTSGSATNSPNGTGSGGGGVSLDTPPQPSQLVHLVKGRAKPPRRIARGVIRADRFDEAWKSLDSSGIEDGGEDVASLPSDEPPSCSKAPSSPPLVSSNSASSTPGGRSGGAALRPDPALLSEVLRHGLRVLPPPPIGSSLAEGTESQPHAAQGPIAAPKSTDAVSNELSARFAALSRLGDNDEALASSEPPKPPLFPRRSRTAVPPSVVDQALSVPAPPPRPDKPAGSVAVNEQPFYDRPLPPTAAGQDESTGASTGRLSVADMAKLFAAK